MGSESLTLLGMLAYLWVRDRHRLLTSKLILLLAEQNPLNFFVFLLMFALSLKLFHTYQDSAAPLGSSVVGESQFFLRQMKRRKRVKH